MVHEFALYAREVKRFQKIWMDTVFSPIVSVILYLSVFGIVAGNRMIGTLPFVAFVYVGLLTMTIVNSSFSNPSFALIIAKNVGTIVDLQLVPIAPWRVGLAYAFAAATRSVITITIATLLTVWFIPLPPIHNFFLLIVAVILTGVEFGLLGVIFGMRAKNFEALTFMTTFIMQPMIFLAGVFYPISQLPGVWSKVSSFNPIHHNINLIRFATTGYADASPLLSLTVIVILALIFLGVSQIITKKSLQN